MNRQALNSILALLVALLAGCGETTTCGDGTVNVGGACVPDPDALNCGDGTALADGLCVALDVGQADVGGTDAAGTDGTSDLETPTDVADAADMNDAATPDACQSNCIGRTCGDNGCGGSCGACSDPAKPVCDALMGQCKPGCVPQCKGKACGDDGCGGMCGYCTDSVKTTCDASGQCVDPCGGPKPLACAAATCGDDGCGSTCGTCASGTQCVSGQCQKIGSLDTCVGHCGSTALSGCYCTKGCEASGNCCSDYAATCTCKPNCTGKTCGDDGCGGSCGACSGTTPYCAANSQCTATCTPKCSGKTCGDDGCGGTCGTCAGGTACAWTNQCVPNAWKCDSSYFGDKGACDCGCGAIDPDCASGKLGVDGCPGSNTCNASGYCDATFCSTDGDCSGKWCTGAWPKSAGLYGGVCGDLFPSGGAAGTPCMIAEECGWGLCLKEACRTHCSTDAQCGAGWLCEGLPVANAATGSTWGFAGACVQPYGSAKACTKQADCSAASETCVARVDPVTLGPRYVCEAVPVLPAAGASCSTSDCPDWQICIDTPKGKKCALPCPGGVADCPSGWTCVDKPLHNAGTPDPSDDPKVPTCQPN